MAKQKKLTIIRADGVIQTRTCRPELRDLQELVGGLIEQIPHFTQYEGRKCVAWCNEEGRINGLPRNAAATALWKSAVGWTLEKQSQGAFWYEPIVFGTLVIEQRP